MKKVIDVVVDAAPAVLLLAAISLVAVAAVIKDSLYAAFGVKAFIGAVLLDKL